MSFEVADLFGGIMKKPRRGGAYQVAKLFGGMKKPRRMVCAGKKKYANFDDCAQNLYNKKSATYRQFNPFDESFKGDKSVVSRCKAYLPSAPRAVVPKMQLCDLKRVAKQAGIRLTKSAVNASGKRVLRPKNKSELMKELKI